MALVLADRVLETCTSPGTGAVTLLGATTGYQTFSSGIGDGNTCYYCIADIEGVNWEVGIGTYASTGNTLTRTTPISGSSATPVNFSTGTQNVFVTYPAEKSVNKDDVGNVIIEAATNTGSALRITQTGTGNALVVEDSANPDSTPFVVDTNGYVIQGNTSRVTMPTGDGGLYGAGIEVLGTAGGTSSYGAAIYNNAAAGFGASLSLAKSNSATVGSHSIVANSDLLGAIYFSGSDGTNFIRAAQILANVDGTPGTNDMPGRLVFSTTADGASSPTERMRIGSNGTFGYNIANAASVGHYNYFAALSGTNVYGNLNTLVAASGTTASIRGFNTNIGTTAASFTLGNSYHYLAGQGTVGAGSTITNQYGFYSDASLTGATNNYGFYSALTSGTGRYNFYAAGSAKNYFAGNVGIGVDPDISGAQLALASSVSTQPVITSRNETNNASSTRWFMDKVRAGAIVQSGDEIGSFLFRGYDGSAFLTAALIRAEVDGTPGTNDMPGRLIFSTAADGASNSTERMRIDSSGNVGIGNAPITGATLSVRKNITGATTAYGVLNYAEIQSDVTSGASFYQTLPSTQAAAFTLGSLRHFYANQSTIGAGSTITNQFGYHAESSLTGATNNYGFFSNIASGTGRYNFYAAGSADNYFASNVGIGKTAPTFPLHTYLNSSVQAAFENTGATTSFVVLRNTTSTGNNIRIGSDTNDLTLFTNGTERMRIDSAGRVGIGTNTAATTLLQLGGTLPSSSALSFATSSVGTVPSTTTSQARYYSTYASTAAAAFTLSNLWHYYATQGTIGAGSTVTSQFGFAVENSLTGATNNYGFYSNIAAGTGRYNFYAAGSATNYFAGVILGDNYVEAATNAAAGCGLRVKTPSGSGSAAIIQFTNNPVTAQWASITSPAANVLAFNDGGSVERMRITSAGGVSFGSTGTAYGTAGQVLTSNGNAPPSWQSASGGAQGFVTQFTGYNAAPGGFVANQSFALI